MTIFAAYNYWGDLIATGDTYQQAFEKALWSGYSEAEFDVFKVNP